MAKTKEIRRDKSWPRESEDADLSRKGLVEPTAGHHGPMGYHGPRLVLTGQVSISQQEGIHPHSPGDYFW